MFDKLRALLLQLGLQQFGPSAVRGIILGAAGWLLVRNGALSAYGIVSDAAAHTTIIYWDKLSVATIAALPAIIAGIIKLIQYHGTNVVTSLKGEPK